MTGVMNVDIEMIAPEKRRHNKRFSCSQNVACRGLTLAFGHHPVLHPNSPGARIGPARNVSCGENSWHVSFEEFVYQNAILRRDPDALCQRRIGPHADSGDNEIAL